MRRPDDSLLLDMLDAANRVEAMMRGCARTDFDHDDKLQLALVYLIQTIGEAASRLSQDLRAAHPEYPSET